MDSGNVTEIRVYAGIDFSEFDSCQPLVEPVTAN
jgi:hypothetical protein